MTPMLARTAFLFTIVLAGCGGLNQPAAPSNNASARPGFQLPVTLKPGDRFAYYFGTFGDVTDSTVVEVRGQWILCQQLDALPVWVNTEKVIYFVAEPEKMGPQKPPKRS
jgi:hypothetical protein